MDNPPGSARVALDLLRAQREGASGLARRREDRLVALVTYARAKSRYYERLYRDLPNDPVVLRDLPPVAKPELMASFDDWVTDPGVTRAGVEAFIANPAWIAGPYFGALGQGFDTKQLPGTTRSGWFAFDVPESVTDITTLNVQSDPLPGTTNPPTLVRFG